MIFLTVGTLFPFDRLVLAVDDAVSKGLIDEPVFAQIGKSKIKPKNIEYVESLDKEQFDEKVKTASAFISHAGMGSITMALSQNKPLLVMPRMKKYGEHVNDHQVGTAVQFEQLGHVLAVYDENHLADKLKLLKNFTPAPRIAQPTLVAQRISRFLEQLSDKNSS